MDIEKNKPKTRNKLSKQVFLRNATFEYLMRYVYGACYKDIGKHAHDYQYVHGCYSKVIKIMCDLVNETRDQSNKKELIKSLLEFVAITSEELDDDTIYKCNMILLTVAQVLGFNSLSGEREVSERDIEQDVILLKKIYEERVIA